MILTAWGLKSSQSYGQNVTEKMGLGQWCNFMLQKFSCGHSYLVHHHRWWLRYTKTMQQSAVSIMFLGDPPCKIQEIRVLESKIVASFFGKAEYTCCLCASSGPVYSQCWLIQAPLVASGEVFKKRSLWSHAVPQQGKCTHCHSNNAFSFHQWTAAGSLPILLSKFSPVWLVPNPTPTSEKALWVQGTRVESQGSH